jgi:hypothetical protein
LAGGQLAGGQLGRHAGLAVRRQLHPGRGAPVGHRRQVARQRRLAQREHRVAEALVGRFGGALAQRRQALRDQRRQRMRHLAS